jgi:hypothetical protein
MAFIAAIEIDKRQQIIVAADKMKEMLGGSWTIAETRKLAETLVPQGAGVTLIKVASGDIWMRAEELVDLETCLWQFRQKIVYELGLPCSFAIVEERSPLTDTRAELSKSIRKVKDEKSGEVGHLSLPWFAPCQVQPVVYANHWIPNWEKHEQHKRRALISESSFKRLERGFKTLEEYYYDKSQSPKIARFPIIDRADLKAPQSINDFASGADGSYLALLRFDADQSHCCPV